MNIITVKNLIKDYNNLRAVDYISFEIAEGECFGFLGPNGAGKTSVMRIIYCFMPPTTGEVNVFGLNVTQNPSEIKAKIGVMPQEDNLDPDLSVYENLVVYARYFNISKHDSKNHINELLKFIELEDKRDTKIDRLSGGMKRKLVLARALINNPQILILDEPTTGLDPNSRRAVWEMLRLLKSKKITLILTTHYMEEAEKLCDRVAIMSKGKIITIDTITNLKQIHKCNLEEVYIKLTGRKLVEH